MKQFMHLLKKQIVLFEPNGETIEINEIVRPSESFIKMFYKKSKRMNDKLSLYRLDENGGYSPIDIKNNIKTFREFEDKKFFVLRDLQDFVFTFKKIELHLTQPFIPEIETVYFLIDKCISDMIGIPSDRIRMISNNEEVDENELICNLISEKKKFKIELRDNQIKVPFLRERNTSQNIINQATVPTRKLRSKTLNFPEKMDPLQSFMLDSMIDESKESIENIEDFVNKGNQNVFIYQDDESIYELIEKIHEGSISSLFKIKNTETDEFMCKKVIRIRSNLEFNDLKNSMKEFDIRNYVNHPCICKLIKFNPIEYISNEMNEEITTVVFFFEYLDLKLIDYLKVIKNDPTKKAKIVLEIAHTMAYLHKRGIIFCDLNVDNIMIDSNFNVKIIDFHHAQINKSIENDVSIMNDPMSIGFGTLAFMSPEMINEDEYGFKADTYSFGIVLYFIYFGCLPKQNMKDKMSGKTFPLPKESDSASSLVLDLISKCVAFNPSQRPTFKEILNDVRMNSYLFSKGVDDALLSRRDLELIGYLQKTPNL